MGDAPGDDPTRPDAPPTEAGTAATRREGQGARKGEGQDEDREERLPPGTKIGRYVVVDVLGAGGMGVVYSAFDPELDRKVAVKLLQAQHGGSESGGQSWILREAQALARLAHPNVVAVYDMGAMSGDRVFVAMELVDGVTLRQWLKQERTWREVLPVLRAAGQGLAAAHAVGLVHRDFKPDNVIVGNDGRTRVMDFGLARLGTSEAPAARTSDLHIESRSPLSARLTQTGAVLGTPAYMAPEIYGGRGSDARTDQFAFGVALYEALYRKRPYNRADLVEQRATVPKPAATAKVPAWLERVALRAIAIEPEARFASIDELLVALEPPRSKLPWVAGASVAGAAIAVGAFVLARGGGGVPPVEPCTDSPARLASVWDAGKRGALEADFKKVGKPFVADAIAGTEKSLDAYGSGWVAMRTEACKATRVSGEQSEDVLTLRMACLDQRLVELDALVKLFASADESLVLGAATATTKLSSLADCADVPALLAPDPLPRDPARREKVVALQAKLAEARAIYKASRPKDTLAITTAIAGDVATTQHKPTEALAHFLTGQALWVLEGADKGEPELMKAVLDAEAGKADDIKVEAWLQLTNLANESNKFDVAADRLQQATAALARLGTKWDLKVRVLDSGALLASRQNHFDKALADAKEAIDTAAKHGDASTNAYALIVEATILNSSLHAPEALADFKKVLAYHEGFGHNRIEVATTLQTMASAELVLGRTDDAMAHAKDALAIFTAIFGPDNLEIARVQSMIGAIQATKGDLAGALATDQQALELAKKTAGEDSDLYAMILGQLAGNLVEMGKHQDAVPYLDRAIAIQTAKLGPGHVQTLTLKLTKCDALHAANQLPAALDECRRALAAAEESLGKTSPIIFIFLGHTGTVLLDAKKPKEASAMFERAIELGANDPSDLDYLAMMDARARWDMGDRKRAIELATSARDGFAKLGDDKKDQAKEAADWLKVHH